MLLRRAPEESYDALRRRILRETESAILFGLLHPDKCQKIPTLIVGTARFHPDFAEQFWREALELDRDESVGFLRRITSAFRHFAGS